MLSRQVILMEVRVYCRIAKSIAKQWTLLSDEKSGKLKGEAKLSSNFVSLPIAGPKKVRQKA